MKTTSYNKNAEGFTLLELLIALVLLVLLSTALYGTYFSVIRGSEAARERIEPLRDVRATLDMMRREISSAYFNTDNKKLHFIVEDRDIFGKPASILEFTTFTVPRKGSAPSSDLMTVRYEPYEKEENTFIISRKSLDLYLTGEPVAYPLTGVIEGFLVECYDGADWVKSWNTELNGGLPKAVRITMKIKGTDTPVSFTAITVPRVTGT